MLFKKASNLNQDMSKIKELFTYAIEDAADPRTKSWFLVYSPWPPLFIMIVYIIFSWNAKKIMRHREAWHMRPFMFMYNYSLVVLSAYMAYEYFMSSFLAGYNLYCQPVDYSTSPLAMRMANVSWWYFISKYVELLDTVIFALRKKFSQITFLHVYHHSTMLLNWWLSVKYVPGGQTFFIALLNSSIHVFMYSYYALSLFPEMKKYLWWKKYLTGLQIAQFVAIFLHCGYNLTIKCNFPRWLNQIVMCYMLSLIALFVHFYITAYIKKKAKRH